MPLEIITMPRGKVERLGIDVSMMKTKGKVEIPW